MIFHLFHNIAQYFGPKQKYNLLREGGGTLQVVNEEKNEHFLILNLSQNFKVIILRHEIDIF